MIVRVFTIRLLNKILYAFILLHCNFVMVSHLFLVLLLILVIILPLLLIHNFFPLLFAIN
jgi:hypothetical protein